MNFPPKKIDLDFGRKTIPVTVFAKQRDNESRSLEITPLNCGQRLEIGDDITARLELTKPDGYSVVNDQSIKNGIILVELTEQILAAAGTATAEIALYKNGARLSSQVFYIDVQESACDEGKIESSNEFTSFADVIEKANETTNAAQTLVGVITEKLENGDFKGEKGERGEQGLQGARGEQGIQGERGEKGEQGAQGERGEKGDSYILSASDKMEIAEQAAELAGAMQGGTVTYSIPLKECRIELTNSDSSAMGLATILIPFATLKVDDKQFQQNIETGVIEMPEDFYTWELAEQEKFVLDIFTPYISDFNIKPWALEPRKPWLEFIIDTLFFDKRMLEQSMEIGELVGIESNGMCTMFLNKIFNNDFKVSIFAENQAGEVAYSAIKSDMAFDTINLNSEHPFMIPFFGFTAETDETGITTITIALLAIGILSGYGSLLTGFSSYVIADDIKEIAITFIPNNAVVEDYDNE